jgi:hypothetical protein
LEAFFWRKIFLTDCWHGGDNAARGSRREGVQPGWRDSISPHKGHFQLVSATKSALKTISVLRHENVPRGQYD